MLLAQQLLEQLLSSRRMRLLPRRRLLSNRALVLDTEIEDLLSVASTALVTVLSSAVREPQTWWVRQRSLAWFDSFLSQAYGMERWNDILKMPKHLFVWLCGMLGPRICKKNTRWRRAVPVGVRLGAVLFRLVTDHTYFYVSDRFGIGESILGEMFEEVIDAINIVLGPQFLRWPLSEENGAISDGFYRKCGLPNIAGAIDATNVRIRTPKHADRPVRYFNRKKFHSLALQEVCDSDGCFLDVNVGLPGSTNDQRLLSFSGLYNQVQYNNEKMGWPVCQINGGFRLRPYLLGDSGYTISPWLIVPYLQSSQLTAMEQLYNEHHVRGRLVIEQAFRHLKSKFKILETRINSSVHWAAKVAYSCCVINNILVKYRVGSGESEVIPAYDRIGATAVRNFENASFHVGNEQFPGLSDSEL